MSAKIVVVPPSSEIGEIAREMAPAGFELVLARNDRPEIEAVLGTAEYMVCYPHVAMKDAFYRAAPQLKLVQLLSAGYDDVDLEAARRAKVPVSNNGGANAISVAEHAMMLMLAVSRRVIWQHDNVSGGRWRGNGPAPRMYEIYDKTLGIVGLGTIGKKVARLARAFGMRVQYYDIARLSEDAEDVLGVRFRLLRELLRELRHRDAARAAQRFDAPHDRRGRACADEARGDHRQHQPRPGDRRGRADQARSPTTSCSAPASTCSTRSRRRPTIRCFKLDNVVLTSHFAGPTWDNHVARFRNAFDNVQRVHRGEKPLWVVPELAELVK